MNSDRTANERELLLQLHLPGSVVELRVSKNIAYRTHIISDFYRSHRRSWAELYPSERRIFETIAARGADFSTVLDVGCAAGGLAEALMEHFGSLHSYTGIDVNQPAIAVARTLPSRIADKRTFIAADICDCAELDGHAFDLVTALGVADWNIDADGILAKCWEHVRPGGRLVISLRLTPGEGVSDIDRSYQYIWFDRESAPPPEAERAPYSVFNVDAAIGWLCRQAPTPDLIQISGYWGTPSPTAHTLYDRIVFSAIAMRKPASRKPANEPAIETDLPDDVFRPLSPHRHSS
jgi:SAM-dependent methyltransferase